MTFSYVTRGATRIEIEINGIVTKLVEIGTNISIRTTSTKVSINGTKLVRNKLMAIGLPRVGTNVVVVE